MKRKQQVSQFAPQRITRQRVKTEVDVNVAAIFKFETEAINVPIPGGKQVIDIIIYTREDNEYTFVHKKTSITFKKGTSFYLVVDGVETKCKDCNLVAQDYITALASTASTIETYQLSYLLHALSIVFGWQPKPTRKENQKPKKITIISLMDALAALSLT